MKVLIGVLLMASVAWGGEKPYAGVNVTIRATHVQSGMLKIEAQSTMWRPAERQEYRSFIMSCAVGNAKCVSPEVGEIYVLQTPSAKTSCDGYDLGREKRIPVCLIAVR